MERPPKSILVVEDEANMRRILVAFLRRESYPVTEASDGLEARDILAQRAFQVVITDQKMPRMDGLALLAHCAERYPEIPVILITAHSTIETAVKAMKEGAFDYTTKPFEEAELLAVVRKAMEVSAKRHQEPAVAAVDLQKYGMVGKSPGMREIFRLMEKVADSPSTVLLIGETGTGKELIARALHTQSGRRDNPFIAINCGAIPENLVESELFGYERGAFTGAVTSKPGRFELAEKGTLFLDEVGELRKEAQVKLLRVLQEQTFERVGGIKTLRMDVRLIAATIRDMARILDHHGLAPVPVDLDMDQLALALQIPIVPVGISGCREVFCPGRFSPRGGIVRIHMGVPLQMAPETVPQGFCFFHPEAEASMRPQLQGAAELLMGKINILLDTPYRWTEDRRSDGAQGTHRFV